MGAGIPGPQSDLYRSMDDNLEYRCPSIYGNISVYRSALGQRARKDGAWDNLVSWNHWVLW